MSFNFHKYIIISSKDVGIYYGFTSFSLFPVSKDGIEVVRCKLQVFVIQLLAVLNHDHMMALHHWLNVHMTGDKNPKLNVLFRNEEAEKK